MHSEGKLHGNSAAKRQSANSSCTTKKDGFSSQKGIRETACKKLTQVKLSVPSSCVANSTCFLFICAITAMQVSSFLHYSYTNFRSIFLTHAISFPRSCEVLPARCFILSPLMETFQFGDKALKDLLKCSYVCDACEKLAMYKRRRVIHNAVQWT